MHLLFAAALLAATPAGPAPGTYTYAGSIAGRQLVQTTMTVAASAQGTTLNESAAGTLNGDRQTAQTVLSLDTALDPQSYSLAYTAAGKAQHSSLAFSDKGAWETSDGAPQIMFTLAANTRHFVVLDPTMFSGFFALPAQINAWGSMPVTAIAPMFRHSEPLSVNSNAAGAARPANVPQSDSAVSLSGPAGQLTLWYDPATFIVDELDVPSQDAKVVRQR